MTLEPAPRTAVVPPWAILLVAVAALVLAAVALTATLLAPRAGWSGVGMGNGAGMMGGVVPNGASETGPGQPGFVAGTAAAPRVVRIWAGPAYTFSPSTIAVARGETVTFVVTTMGPLVHEFMVGPAAAVAADIEGTPEVADIGMMQTGSLTYTFDGSGPYAFACHATGHYEAGMRGTITVLD